MRSIPRSCAPPWEMMLPPNDSTNRTRRTRSAWASNALPRAAALAMSAGRATWFMSGSSSEFSDSPSEASAYSSEDDAPRAKKAAPSAAKRPAKRARPSDPPAEPAAKRKATPKDKGKPAPKASRTPAKSVEKAQGEDGEEGATSKMKKAAPKRGHLPDSLPVVIPSALCSRDPAKNTMMFVHLTGGQVDLEGDVGAIGRLTVTSEGVLVDLQGHMYAGAIVPTCTQLVLALGPTEAKVEAIASDAVLLTHVDSSFDRMGASLVSGSDALEQMLTFEDVHAASSSGRVAGGESDAEEASAAKTKKRGKGTASSKSSQGVKNRLPKFFGSRRTAATKTGAKAKPKKRAPKHD
jgi:hypothetical protein